MKAGDYVYYINKYGAHEPARVLKIANRRIKIISDGSGSTNAGEKWVSKSNLEPQ